MKIYSIVFAFILFTVTTFAQKPHTAKDLIGKWEGKDSRSEVGGLFFLKDSKVVISARGSFSPAMNYTVDFKSNPVKIDMQMENPNGGMRMTMKGLLQFIDNNTIKFQVFPDGNRPANFNPLSSQNMVLLKRGGTQ